MTEASLSGYQALVALVPRIGSRLRLRAFPAAAGLCALVAVSTAVRVAVGVTVPAPTVFSDELVYSDLARSFAASADFAVRGSHVAAWTYGPLYPILVSPAYLLSDSAAGAFEIVKLINAVLFSLAALPAYFLARRVLSRRAALVAAVLTLLVPSGVYTTKVMAESASYPAFLLAMLGMVAALERPSRRNLLLALGAICISVSARPQMIVLLPAFLNAIALGAWIDSRTAPHTPSPLRRVLASKAVWVATVGPGVAGVAALALGSGLLGAYKSVLHKLRLELVPERLLWLVGDLDLYAAVIPLCAFLLLTFWAVTGAGVRRRLQLYLISAWTASIWLVGMIAVYTTAFGVVYDRYIFYLVPLFVIALLAWIERGVPRPSGRWAAAAIGAAALVPAGLPLARLLSTGQLWGANASSVGLIPWGLVGVLTGRGMALRLVVLGFSVGLAVAVGRVRVERAWSLARITAALLLFAGLTVNLGNTALARNLGREGDQDRAWIDARLGSRAEVAVVWRGLDSHAQPADRRFALREAVFFNRAVGPIYDLEDPLFPGIPSIHVSLRGHLAVRDDGRPVRAEYVLAAPALSVRGVRVAGDAGSGLALYRVPGLIRMGG